MWFLYFMIRWQRQDKKDNSLWIIQTKLNNTRRHRLVNKQFGNKDNTGSMDWMHLCEKNNCVLFCFCYVLFCLSYFFFFFGAGCGWFWSYASIFRIFLPKCQDNFWQNILVLWNIWPMSPDIKTDCKLTNCVWNKGKLICRHINIVTVC